MLPQTNQNRLAALLDKLDNIDLGDSMFYRPKEGSGNVIRILPPTPSMEPLFFVETGTHYIAATKTYLSCPKATNAGDCPLCEFNEELYRSGNKELAKEYRSTKQFMVNVIDRA